MFVVKCVQIYRLDDKQSASANKIITYNNKQGYNIWLVYKLILLYAFYQVILH